MSEQVLVFPASVLEHLLPGFSGIREADAAALEVLNSDNLFFMDRALAETDPTFKQVIPYVIIRNGTRVLSYERTPKGGDARLHNRRSIGFGGHINPGDGHGNISYEKAFWRELAEELSLERQPNEQMPTPSAVLYEADTDVGRVHFGVVHLMDVSDSFSWNPEADASVANVAWLEIASLREMSEQGQFEGWSRMVIDSLLARPEAVSEVKVVEVSSPEVTVTEAAEPTVPTNSSESQTPTEPTAVVPEQAAV